MFWKKKDKAQQRREELRRFYRRVPSKKHALSVQIRGDGSSTVSGELADVSAGGAGVFFATAQDPKLAEGGGVILTFSALGRGGPILATSRVTSVMEEEDGTRYGFEFIDLPGLFAQLDEYYVRFFNRRRVPRVRPGLDQKIEVGLSLPAGSLSGRMHDFSTEGIGVLLARDEAQALSGVEALEARFVVPKSRVEVRWAMRVVHQNSAKAGIVLGGEFTPVDHGALSDQRRALSEFAAARAAEMARWDSAYE